MSKLLKSLLIVAALSSVAGAPAWADSHGYRRGSHDAYRGHGGAGWGALGLALFGTAVYLAATAPPPPPFRPVPVYTPQVYVQQPVVVTLAAPPPAPAVQEYWWYYCSQAGGYYPYIRACPTGWTKVPATPPQYDR
jgi:hypothetical protein